MRSSLRDYREGFGLHHHTVSLDTGAIDDDDTPHQKTLSSYKIFTQGKPQNWTNIFWAYKAKK